MYGRFIRFEALQLFWYDFKSMSRWAYSLRRPVRSRRDSLVRITASRLADLTSTMSNCVWSRRYVYPYRSCRTPSCVQSQCHNHTRRAYDDRDLANWPWHWHASLARPPLAFSICFATETDTRLWRLRMTILYISRNGGSTVTHTRGINDRTDENV